MPIKANSLRVGDKLWLVKSFEPPCIIEIEIAVDGISPLDFQYYEGELVQSISRRALPDRMFLTRLEALAAIFAYAAKEEKREKARASERRKSLRALIVRAKQLASEVYSK